MGSTIAAAATAPGRAAVAVVRVSGPSARTVLAGLGARPGPPRKATLRRLVDRNGEPLDDALVLWFPAPSSYTGEDLVEVHLHGGRSVVARALETMVNAGARLAEPGEFTRRAFEAGKLDLAQAEAIGDLIEAETQGQARQALAQLRGALSDRQAGWRGRLVALLAQLEALVDFPDEEVDAPLGPARDEMVALADELDASAGDLARGRAIREGWRVAIVGAPNAGKSSLFNRLAGREAAIVTALPGTTRDVIELPLDIEGYRVLLADMAGLRAATDEVEAEGVRRAERWANEADLRMWVVDGAAPALADPAEALVRTGDLLVINKADLGLGDAALKLAGDAEARGLDVIEASQKPDRPERVAPWLARRVVEALGSAGFPSATRLRHASAIRAASERLRSAAVVEEVELAAEEVRLAVRALQSITGVVGPEDVLASVFSTFCIGK